MSLNWNLEKIADYKTVCWTEDGGLSPTTESLIWATLAIGVGEITSKTEAEFYARINLYERTFGAFQVKLGEDGKREEVYITREDIRSHRGLSTNVFPMETRTKWLKRIFDRALTDRVRAYERDMGEAVA